MAIVERRYSSDEQASFVLKEALWLAWQAAGGPQGMGFMQDRPHADKEAVWDQAYNMKDYSGRLPYLGADLNADYVFGRMLKLRVRRPSPETLSFSDSEPRHDYQSWCGKYKTYAALFDAAEKAIGAERLAE